MLEKFFSPTEPKLAYLTYESYFQPGVSPTLIIMHGLFGMADNWNSVALELVEKFETQGHGLKVISLDLPGHGGSDRLGHYSYENLALGVYEGISGVAEGPIYLLGHSLGGKVAMALADQGRFPGFVQLRGLIVVDIAPVEYPDSHTLLFSALRELDLSTSRTRGQAQAALKVSIPDPGVRGFLIKNLEFDLSKDPRWLVDLEGLQRSYSQLRSWPGFHGHYSGPALWICGGSSEYMEPRESREKSIFSFAPVAKIEYIEGAGHWVHAEQRDRVVESLYEFLRTTEQENIIL